MSKTKRIKYKYDYKRAYLIIQKITEQAEKSEILLADAARSRELLSIAFEEYGGYKTLEKVNFAFMIPTRVTRFHPEYWEEAYEFFPVLRYGSLDLAMEFLASLPPFKIEMYGKEGEPSSGVLIFVPVFDDMRKDYRSKILLLRDARRRIVDAAKLAHEKMGVKYIGLGATLPRITDYGRTVSKKVDVITTTGHAGTTSLLTSTVVAQVDINFKDKKSLTIGFIGGGAIGSASMVAIAAKYPHAKMLTYDKRTEVNKINQMNMRKKGIELKIAESNESLIINSDVIVSAITSQISVKGLKLDGKIIIDDSQPGSFIREDVINAGGILCWVIGKDTSKNKIVTRRGSYSYGPHGLCHVNDVWGCEAEVATIAALEDSSLAVNKPVTLEQIAAMGKAFQKVGIEVALPQSHGTLN